MRVGPSASLGDLLIPFMVAAAAWQLLGVVS